MKKGRTHLTRFEDRTPAEKVLFAITIIVGLSVILGSIAIGCADHLGECNVYCKGGCTPIIMCVVLLLIVSAIYAMDEGEKWVHSELPYIRALRKECGNSNPMVILSCYMSIMIFLGIFLVVLIHDKIIVNLLIIAVFFYFFLIVRISSLLRCLEKIFKKTKKLKWKTTNLLCQKRTMNKEKQ